jgi:hypothetical protein
MKQPLFPGPWEPLVVGRGGGWRGTTVSSLRFCSSDDCSFFCRADLWGHYGGTCDVTDTDKLHTSSLFLAICSYLRDADLHGGPFCVVLFWFSGISILLYLQLLTWTLEHSQK